MISGIIKYQDWGKFLVTFPSWYAISSISCQVALVTSKHHRSHISSMILFKLDKNIAWTKILLELKNGLCGRQSGSIIACNIGKCFSPPKKTICNRNVIFNTTKHQDWGKLFGNLSVTLTPSSRSWHTMSSQVLCTMLY